MIDNLVLFHAFDIGWTIARVLGAAAVLSSLLGFGVFLPYILVRHGRIRSMSADELAYMGRREPGEVRMNYVGARGGRVEAKASIDTLRRLAKRGEWALFLAWPAAMTSMALSFVFGCMAQGISEPKTFWLMAGIAAFIVLCFIGPTLFMPWAALYTNIDLDVDGPDPDNPLPVGPLPPVPDAERERDL